MPYLTVELTVYQPRSLVLAESPNALTPVTCQALTYGPIMHLSHLKTPSILLVGESEEPLRDPPLPTNIMLQLMLGSPFQA